MAILKSDSNIVAIPLNVSVNKKGYVYLNQSTSWVDKKNGPGKTADHNKVCIGITVKSPQEISWHEDRRMYANPTYYNIFHPQFDEAGEKKEITKTEEVRELIHEYPKRSDCMSVGLHVVIMKIAEESQLLDTLTEVFGREDTELILDLAAYMLSEGTAVFQHFPHWARSHVIFCEEIHTDSFISKFVKEGISFSQIEQFKKKWFIVVLGDGRIYLCYDSTNVNSQAEGVFIVQKGHAKDDPSLDQVNFEYVLRQQGGLPMTFNCYPGSINDVAEASEIIKFLGEMLKEIKKTSNESSASGTKTDNNTVAINHLADSQSTENAGIGCEASSVMEKIHQVLLIADRGYVSEENIKESKKLGISFLLMLKRTMSLHDEILDQHLSEVKMPANYLPSSQKFALTVRGKLFDDDTEDSYFHIIWDPELELAHRSQLFNELNATEGRIKKAMERKTLLTADEIKKYECYFNLNCHEDGTLKVNQRGRGAGKTKNVAAYVIDQYSRDDSAIKSASDRCGYVVCVSDIITSAIEAIGAISKRDIVEKIFRALKSFLGMDKLGVYSESSMQTKSLIWFVAAILYSLIFNKTEKLRVKNKKNYTMPCIIDYLEEITADRDLDTGKYKRRYKLVKCQREILDCFKLTDADIDSKINEIEY